MKPAISSGFDYKAAFGVQYHGARRLPPAAEKLIAQLRSRKISPWISPGDRVLEYGVGFGWNLAAVRCAEKAGFDVVPELRNVVQARGIEFTDALNTLPLGAFDVVLSHHTLEHVPSPMTSLCNMFRFLKPGGLLLLFAPYERELKYHHYKRPDKSHHLYSWSPEALAHLVSRTGGVVEQVKVQRFRFDRIAALVACRLKANDTIYTLIRNISLFMFPEYEIRLCARVARPMRTDLG